MLCSLSDLKFDLFYRYRFRQISRLVYIQILSERSIIGNQLQHDSDREHGEAVVYIRNADSDISQIVIHYRAFFCQQNYKGSAGFDLTDVGNGLGEHMFLSCNGNDRYLIRNQGNGAVL